MTTERVERQGRLRGRNRSPNDLLLIPGAQRSSPGPVVPAVLAGLTIALQIAYPLLAGGALRRVTIATVVAFAAASLAHAWCHRGPAWAVRLFAVAGSIGLAVEVLGLRTGIPFGEYRYLGTLGPALLDVPLVIPLAWTMMAYPAAVVAARVTASVPVRVLVAAWALAAWDFFLDPQMVAAGHWAWQDSGPALAGIPLVNHVGWFAAALAIQLLLVPGMSETDDDRVPVALYVWTWASSILAHAVFFGLPMSAVTGGVAMGVVVAALLRSR